MLKYSAADRNKDAILQVLTTIVKSHYNNQDIQPLNALEIGSGSGQHVTHMARHLPHIRWQPTDVDQSLFESINSYIKHFNLTNVCPAVQLDVSSPSNRWPIFESEKFDLIYCANVIHISPWKCTIGLFEGSSMILSPKSGLLLTYGPYACDGVITPDSNVSFDDSLRQSNPEWGLRDIRDLKELATTNGLSFVSMHEMPANNKILVFKKT
ncbi:methyltransferase-like 26 [Oppia nitens]|uniref:methyltransferase-like 26 n=1 Tax=Oppia nitens TaxID=1686743 RepID=UPI0023DA696F|nr:methyltransferase-like 26 [Oppia nitens]